MRFENVGAISPQRGSQPIDRLLHLLLCDIDRLVKADNLGLDLLVRQEEPHNPALRIVDQKGPPNRDSLTDSDPFKPLLIIFSPQIAHWQTPSGFKRGQS